MSESERVEALGALYQGEKSDAASIFNTSMAMMGIGAAYLLGAVGYADKYGSSSLPWMAVLLLPAPLWCIAAFHSLITLSAMAHGVSVQIIEDGLFRESGISSGLRDSVGSRAGDRIMDIRQSHRIHRFATMFVYGGVGLAVVGFTFYIVWESWVHVPRWAQVASILAYSLEALIVLGSWLIGLRLVDRMMKAREPAGTEQVPASTNAPRSIDVNELDSTLKADSFLAE